MIPDHSDQLGASAICSISLLELSSWGLLTWHVHCLRDIEARLARLARWCDWARNDEVEHSNGLYDEVQVLARNMRRFEARLGAVEYSHPPLPLDCLQGLRDEARERTHDPAYWQDATYWRAEHRRLAAIVEGLTQKE